MKVLYLLRHAKSDWNAGYVGDHERPLSGRGRKAAGRIGRFLAARNDYPELILCSTAVRTCQTLDLVLEKTMWTDVDIRMDKTLYLATYEQAMQCLSNVPDSVDSVMIIGHEPTISLIGGQLIGGASVRFPTAALSRIEMNIEYWRSAHVGVGTLSWHVTPAILKK